MGGIAIIRGGRVPFLILSDYRARSSRCSAPCWRCAALGFVDDWIKLRRRRSLGVSGRTKLLVAGAHRDRALATW